MKRVVAARAPRRLGRPYRGIVAMVLGLALLLPLNVAFELDSR